MPFTIGKTQVCDQRRTYVIQNKEFEASVSGGFRPLMRTRFPWPERKSRNPVATPKTKIQAKKTIRFIIALSIPVPELRNANEMHALPRQNLHILLVAKRADLI